MNIKRRIYSSLAVSVLVVCLTACSTEAQKQAKLQAQAKVTRADAEKIALAKVPNGSIKEAELEKEKGRLVWSFDIATPGSKDITEVAVDAKTGEITGIENETPEQQAKEK